MNDHSGDHRWLSYGELAEARAISRASAIRLVRKHRWPRRVNNAGVTTVAVPVAFTVIDRKDRGDDHGDRPHDRDGDRPGDLALLARVQRAEQRADEANRRADVATALADRTLAQLAEAQMETAKLGDRLDAAEDRARTLQDAAEALRRDLQEAQLAGAEASELRRAAQKAEDDRAAAVAIADKAVEAAEKLRQGEAARAGQGRWARLRAAWRGALVTAFMFGLAQPSWSQATSPGFISGDDLFAYCTTPSAEGMCQMYITGVVDGVLALQEMMPRRGFCIPKEVSGLQIRDVAVQYLKMHPEERHYTGASVVGTAISQAFPCPRY